MKLNKNELKDFLDEKVALYNNPKFIESDPIQIPHQFSKKEDIEIAGFLTATIAWGNRKSIIKNANRMMALMDNTPYEFIIQHNESDLKPLESFVHRTFNGNDFIQVIKSLKHIYTKHDGLETVLSKSSTNLTLQESISHFKTIFFRKTVFFATKLPHIYHEQTNHFTLANPLLFIWSNNI